MRFFTKCQVCKKRKLFIRKRKFLAKHVGVITSKSEMCRGCMKDIKSKI